MARRTQQGSYKITRTAVIRNREEEGRFGVIQADCNHTRVVRRLPDGTAEAGPGELVAAGDVLDVRPTYRVPTGQRRTVTLPLELCRDLGIDVDVMLEILPEDGGFRVRPLPATPPAADLEELVAAINPENVHGEVGTGAPTGRESW